VTLKKIQKLRGEELESAVESVLGCGPFHGTIIDSMLERGFRCVWRFRPPIADWNGCECVFYKGAMVPVNNYMSGDAGTRNEVARAALAAIMAERKRGENNG